MDQPNLHHTNIRIEKIRASDLVLFARREIEKAKAGAFIPITLQRAVAHTNNPNIEPDDISLLVAFEGDTCVGFFGMMPVMLRHGNQFDKVFWFTTWRVSPEFRGKSLGSLLMQEALALDLDYLIVGSGPARRVSRKFGFLEREPLRYFQVDLTGMDRVNPVMWFMRLTRKLLRPLKININIENSVTIGFRRVLSPLTKRIIIPLIWRKFGKPIDEIGIMEVSHVRNIPFETNPVAPHTTLHRGVEVINWMLAYPWILEPGMSATESMDYYFSDVRTVFKNVALEISDPESGEYFGFLVLSISRTNNKMVVKTLDFHLTDPEREKYLLPIILKYAREHNADLVDVPERIGLQIEKSWLYKFLLRGKERIYQFHPKSDDSPLGRCWKEIDLDYCDGDMAFS